MGLSNFNKETVRRLSECMSEKGRIQTSRPCWEWIALTIVEQFGTVNQHGECIAPVIQELQFHGASCRNTHK